MPKSKHRRKGKTRPRTAAGATPTFDDPGMAALVADIDAGGLAADPDDAEFDAALARAEEELAAELEEAAEFDAELDPDAEAEVVEAVMAPLLQAVAEQVRTNDPPAVAATLARLLAEGHDRDHAFRLMAAVLMFELRDVMNNDRDFDPARYAARLAALPQLPDLD